MVLNRFTELPETLRDFPESIEAMKTAKTARGDWGIKAAVIRAGLANHKAEFHQRLKDFWLQSFFSDEYLEFDQPYDGAVQFVRALWNANAEIVYLTGRDVARMGKGSVDVLKKWDFPVAEERASLVLKPLKGMDDADFKSGWFEKISPGTYEHIWFFENEPVNIASLRSRLPNIEVIFFDSAHSGKEPSPADLPTIEHFIFDEPEKEEK